jgi:hypothetical protein
VENDLHLDLDDEDNNHMHNNQLDLSTNNDGPEDCMSEQDLHLVSTNTQNNESSVSKPILINDIAPNEELNHLAPIRSLNHEDFYPVYEEDQEEDESSS